MRLEKGWLQRRLRAYVCPFKSLWIHVALHVGIAVLLPLFFITHYSKLQDYFIMMYWVFSNEITQSMAHTFILYRLNEKYDWIRDTRKRTIYGFIWHVGVTLAIYFPLGIFNFYICYGTPLAEAMHLLLDYWFVPVGILIIVMIFSMAGIFLKNWKVSLIHQEKLKAEMMTYKYESLRSQINPHFLFNSFNVLVNLVDQDPQLAKQFIQQLSRLYRNVLDARDKELVSLREEMAFIESYIFLLKIRFEDKWKVTIDVTPEEDDLVVPMVLQTLIENAVKHNTISRKKPLEVSIIRKNGRIEVVNTLHEKRVPDNSSQRGLKNIRERYKFFSNQEVEVKKEDGKFTVSIPILKQE